MKARLLFPIILIVAFVIRITLVFYFLQPQFSVTSDVKGYRQWGETTYRYGINATYSPNNKKYGISPNNQPVGTAFLFAGGYGLYTNIVNIYKKATGAKLTLIQFEDGFFYVIKLIPAVTDLILSLIIYLIVKREKNITSGLIGASLFLFNPAVIYNSAVWGQYDVINNLFIILALYLLFLKRPLLSSLSFFASFLIKISLLPLLPLFVLIQTLMLKKHKFFRLTILLAGSIGFYLLATLTVSLNPFLWVYRFIIYNMGGELPYVTVYALNFWWFILRPKFLTNVPVAGNTYFLHFTLDFWGYFLFLIPFLFMLVFILIKDKAPKKENIIGYFFLTALLMFLFLARMHERYLYPVLPLLAIYSGITRKYIPTFLIISTIHFINLYISWQPGFLFPVHIEGLMAHWKIRWGLSALLLYFGVYFYWKFVLLRLKKAR